MLNSFVNNVKGDAKVSLSDTIASLNLPKINSSLTLADFSTPKVSTETIDLSIDNNKLGNYNTELTGDSSLSNNSNIESIPTLNNKVNDLSGSANINHIDPYNQNL